MPSIRFGRAHIFNNFYENNLSGSGVNTRMGAVVLVEGNYFLNSDDPIGSWDSPSVGLWDVRDNVFDASSGSQPITSTGSLTPPYPARLDAAADVPAIVTSSAGVGRL
jgi:pectate lyase